MNRVWIDPPSGWQYGFPKIWDKQQPIVEWLIENGYPPAEIEFARKYLRIWPVTNNSE